MSSIYKKGRDGYYYYQTYVYNPLTKKKDKRVFHSLSSKDKDVAEKKQAYYDKKYNNLNNKRTFFYSSIFSIKNFTLGGLLTTFFLFVFIYFDNKNSEASDKYDIAYSSSPMIDQKDSVQYFKNQMINQTKKAIKKNNFKLGKASPVLFNSIIPTYKILRTEEIKDELNLIKIYAVTDNNLHAKNLEKICKKISEENSSNSNLIIFIFSNTESGIEAAMGTSVKTFSDMDNKTWLSFYTKNKIEGEYFDSNPTQYYNIK